MNEFVNEPSKADLALLLGQIDGKMDAMGDEVTKISHVVLGNGDPSSGLAFKFDAMAVSMVGIGTSMTTFVDHMKDKKIHGLGWWKHEYAVKVVGVALAAVTAIAVLVHMSLDGQWAQFGEMVKHLLHI